MRSRWAWAGLAILVAGLSWPISVDAEGKPELSALPIEQLLARAEKGDPEAQFQVGFAFEQADIVAKDAVAAASWYQKAAEQGHVLAQTFLAIDPAPNN